ncbi:MAG: EAL domain-containing protein, partial [Wenzhouxiangella sp.]
ARFDVEPRRPPDAWFADAARAGLTSELEKTALIMGLALLEDLPEDMYIACNLSATALLDPAVRTVLDDFELSRVVIELTEHDIVADYEALIKIIDELRSRGLRIAIDDFGAGYACFRHILFLRPDLIKLDMSLVQDIDTQETKRSLLEAMIGFANASRQTLVAEGVERPSELRTLSNMGVDLAQGYLLHKPMAGADVLGLCHRRQP